MNVKRWLLSLLTAAMLAAVVGGCAEKPQPPMAAPAPGMATAVLVAKGMT